MRLPKYQIEDGQCRCDHNTWVCVVHSDGGNSNGMNCSGNNGLPVAQHQHLHHHLHHYHCETAPRVHPFSIAPGINISIGASFVVSRTEPHAGISSNLHCCENKTFIPALLEKTNADYNYYGCRVSLSHHSGDASCWQRVTLLMMVMSN